MKDLLMREKFFLMKVFLGEFFFSFGDIKIRKNPLIVFLTLVLRASAVRSRVQLTDVTWVHITLSPQKLRDESRRSETEHLLQV